MSTNAIAQTITVSPITPSVEVVVCGSTFLHTLAVVERDIAHLKVTDPASAQQAASYQQRLTKAGQALEAARTVAKAPFLAKGREIDEVARAPAKRIEDAKRSLSKMLVEYNEAQRKAETARLAELAKLEAQKRAEATPEELNLDGTPTERAIQAISQPVATKPAGVSYRVTLFPIVTNIQELADDFVIRTANMQAIRAKYCSGWSEDKPVPVVPGLKFDVQKTAVSTGKSEF